LGYFLSALKIHISLEMKLALDVPGGFKTESRGLIEVKVIELFSSFYRKLIGPMRLKMINLIGKGNDGNLLALWEGRRCGPICRVGNTRIFRKHLSTCLHGRCR
jgi:hypothetical protein